jgi:hypothetical protein
MKRIAIILLCAFIAVSVFAASADTVVYRTKTGEKYHVEGCSSLSRSKIAITLGDAVDRGLGPCARCKPPVLTNE